MGYGTINRFWKRFDALPKRLDNVFKSNKKVLIVFKNYSIEFKLNLKPHSCLSCTGPTPYRCRSNWGKLFVPQGARIQPPPWYKSSGFQIAEQPGRGLAGCLRGWLSCCHPERIWHMQDSILALDFNFK